MPKKIKVLHWLNSGIFPASVMFSCGFSYEEINKHLTKLKAWDWKMGLRESKELIESGTCFGLKRTIYRKKTNEDEKTLFYIILTKCFTYTDFEYCKLAHEVLHICQFMLPDILNRDREFECEAYLHTHLMEQSLKVLRGKNL